MPTDALARTGKSDAQKELSRWEHVFDIFEMLVLSDVQVELDLCWIWLDSWRLVEFWYVM